MIIIPETRKAKENNMTKNLDYLKTKEFQIGLLRALTEGATAGQSQHLAGTLNETMNFPKKLYNATTIKDIIKLYKNIGKDYVISKDTYNQEYNEFKNQHPNFARSGEILGGIASEEIALGYALKIAKLGIDQIRQVKEKNLIQKAYNEVKNNPLLGTRTGKDDVIMVTIKPINDKNTYVINRGAAIKNTNDSSIPIVQGTELERETGTYGNFGMAKIIFKHKIKSEDMQKVPKFLRKYKPLSKKHKENLNWKVSLDEKHNMILSFADDGNNRLKEITINRETIRKNKLYEFSKKK